MLFLCCTIPANIFGNVTLMPEIVILTKVMQPNLFAFRVVIGQVVGNGNSLTFLVNMQAFSNEMQAEKQR